MRSDRTRLSHHAIALLLVAGTVAARAAFSATDGPGAFLLSSVAIAAAGWIGGAAAGLTAVLAALLAARLVGHVDLTASLLFLVEGLTLVWLTDYASRAVVSAARAMSSADDHVRELLGTQRRLLRADAAVRRLEHAAVECAVIVVDENARIVEWRDGAARMFGHGAEAMLGRAAFELFGGADEANGPRLLESISGEEPAQIERLCRRGDGTTFDADVEVHRLPDVAPPAFSLVVRDRTREQEWRAFADASTDLQTALRDEVDVANRQLAVLQYLTDPELNSLSITQAISALLDRLRDAIEADGVAMVRTGRPRRRILAATDGLKPDLAAEWRQADGRSPQTGRILIVHNDPQRVGASSVVGWCEEATSLLAVPIVSGSHVEGTIEAVRLKARRSTEWEIALAQVVAAQIGSRLQNASMFGADAVA